jgi:hypothetical protein
MCAVGQVLKQAAGIKSMEVTDTANKKFAAVEWGDYPFAADVSGMGYAV